MKRSIVTNFLVLLLLFLTRTAEAQSSPSKKSSPKNGGTSQNQVDTTTKPRKDNVGETVDKGNAYLKMAADQKNFFKTMFPAKKGDTVYAVIAGIDYRDPNLKILKQKMDAVKNTKGLTSGYHHGTVIIKILYKQGDASNLYDNLDEGIKELFDVEDMEGCRIILNYKFAKLPEAAVEKTQ